MPQIVLEKKHFLTGISSGGYNQDGLFRQSYTKGIDVFHIKANYGMLQQGNGFTDVTNNGTTSVVVDVIKFFVQKGNDNYGNGNNGRLYKFTGTNLTPSELDHANVGGRTGARGLAIYHDGTSDKLHYFQDTQIGIHDFASTFTNNYKTGLENAPHPAKEFQGVLYFGNGRYVGSLTGTTLDLQALTLPVGYEVQDVDIYSGYIAILAHKPTGALNTECKLFIWDTYTKTGWNFEYFVPEKAYSLEKYKDGLAIFGGYNIMLFGVAGYGNMDVVYSLDSVTVYPGATFYGNNTLYWQEYGFIGSFGTPNSRMKASFQAPLTNCGSGGAIIGLSQVYPQFLVSRSDNYVLAYNSGLSGGCVRTINIPLPSPSKITRLTFIFEKLGVNDEVGFNMYDDQGQLIDTFVVDDPRRISYANFGAITQKSYQINKSKISNFFYIYIDWDQSRYAGGNVVIKKIILDFQPTELKG